MAVLIDSDLLIDLERCGAMSDIERRLGEEDRAISVITVSELLHGVQRARGGVRARRRAFVEHILAVMQAMPVARVHADIWADLSERREPIGAHELWIAATALTDGFGVATGNASHFGRVPGLRVASTRV